MGGALDLLVFIPFLSLIFVALWGIRAAERYFRRRESTVELVAPRRSIWDDFKDAAAGVGVAIGALVAGLVWCFGGLIGCLLALLIFGFVGFFLMLWLVKWLW